MKHERLTGDIQETAALCALGSLSQNEARAFDNHIREGCAVCSNELGRFENVVGELGLAAPDAAPPPQLRGLLAAHLEDTADEAAQSPAALQPEKELFSSIRPAPAKRPGTRPGRLWMRVLPWVLAVAGALAAEEFYFAWKRAQETVRASSDEIAAARGDADQLSGMLQLERRRSRELEHINAVLGKPGARVILLAGTEVSPSASVAILWDTARKRWVVTGSLPPAPAGKIHQLWHVTPSGRHSAGTLEQDPEGHTFKVIDAPATADGIKEIVITLEPAGGSVQPTWPVLATSGMLAR